MQTKDFRSKRFIPTLLERRPRETWEKDGLKDIAMRAREKAKRILRERVPDPKEKNIVSNLEKYIKKMIEAQSH